MSKWHYICKENIIYPDEDDIRNGEYYCYHAKTFNNLLNSDAWVRANDAWDELNWILDTMDKRLESNSGDMVFIPTFKVAAKIDGYYEQKDIEYIAQHTLIY